MKTLNATERNYFDKQKSIIQSAGSFPGVTLFGPSIPTSKIEALTAVAASKYAAMQQARLEAERQKAVQEALKKEAEARAKRERLRKEHERMEISPTGVTP